MIMVNYVDLWLLHYRVASLFDGVRLKLRELKACSTLLGACTTYPLLRSDLKAAAVEIKDLKHRLNYPSWYSILSPLCKLCGSLKGKLFCATKENIELQQEVAYLTACLQKTALSKKMIENDLSRVEKSVTKSIKLGIGLRGVRIRVRRVLPNSFPAPPTIKRRKQSNLSKLVTHPTLREK
jgi:hypothetical protein